MNLITPDAQLTPHNVLTVAIISAVFIIAVLIVLYLPSHRDDGAYEMYPLSTPPEVPDVTVRPYPNVLDEDEPSPDVLSKILGMVTEGAMSGVFDPETEHTKLLYVQPGTTASGMGVEELYDYAQTGEPFDDRLGNCYELAGKAAFEQEIPDGLPAPVAVLHGSWHGPDAPARINHAVVMLSDGRFWEPITRSICEPERFLGYTRFQVNRGYSIRLARHYMLTTKHFGPWDDEIR